MVIQQRQFGSIGLLVVSAVFSGCTTVVTAPSSQLPATATQAPASSTEPEVPTTATASIAAGGAALLPDPAANYTTGDTARLSGGEFVGDQADLTVLEAVALAPTADGGSYAFLVEITGLDDASFHYNLLNFRLIDEQAFQYDALSDGGETPRLEFGDLSPDQKVRGWLTFEGIEDTSTIALEYSPAMALEPATFGFIVP